jgi:uncharacterized protein YggE
MTARREKIMKVVRIGLVVVAVAALAAFVGVGLPEGAKGLSDQPSHAVTVHGTGKASTVPDRAGFSFGVSTKRKTAAEASEANNREMRQVLAALRAAGIRGEDVQTSQISVYPSYSESGSEVVGYEASNSVTATVPLAKAGDALQAAVGAGANQVDGPSLTKADTDKLYADALRAAVADARSRAEVLAAAAGVKLGEVVAIEEGSEPSGPIPYALDAAASPEQAPIEPGKQDIEADVTVSFAIA